MRPFDFIYRPNIPLSRRLFTAGKVIFTIGMLALFVDPIKEHIPRGAAAAWFAVGMILSIADAFMNFRLKRPRWRMLELAIWALVLTVVCAVVACVVYVDGASGWGYPVVFSVMAAIFAIWSFLRWQRLKSDAEVYLAMLKVKRSNRLKKRMI